MSQSSKRIKSITVRFNREVLPFQHIRIEVVSTISKDNDVDEVTEELLTHLKHVSDQVEERIFKAKLSIKKEKEGDDIHY